MKRIFYSFFFLFSAVTIFAQRPGGVDNSVLWLKGDAAADGSAWPDNSVNGNGFIQDVPAKQPALSSNIYNFYPAMTFNGSSSYLYRNAPITGFPAGNQNRTVFVVANSAAPASFYSWILTYGSPGTTNATFQVGDRGTTLAYAFYGGVSSDITSPLSFWNTPSNTSGALASFTFNSNTGTQYDKGVSINSQTISATLTAASENAAIGAIDLGHPTEFWSGSIGEIIMFPTALGDAQRNQVESYLAVKYGLTLGSNSTPVNYTAGDGTVYWTGSTTFQNDVFGIGTDNSAASGSGLTQLKSNSMGSGSGNGTGQNGKGNLILATPTLLSNGQFLMIGNDGGSFAETTIASGEASLIAVGSKRVQRKWKVQNTNGVGAVNLSFDTTGFTFAGGAAAGSYRLMIDPDGDFATGTQTFAKPTSFTGNQMNFDGIILGNNSAFTIITQASALLPAVWQDFTASLLKNTATLIWKTSNEVNVDHYTVEYSSNGVDFIPAGTVAAKNGTGVNTYTLTQDNLPAGTRYYRIKQVDKDGKFQYSELRSVKAGGYLSVLLKTNPVISDKLELNIDVPQSQDAMIRVVGISGNVLLQKNIGLSTGTNSVSANIHLAAGTYFVQVQLGSTTINKKFIRL